MALPIIALWCRLASVRWTGVGPGATLLVSALLLFPCEGHVVESEDVELAAIMKAYAEDAVRLATRHQVELDYSEESLARVDRLVLRLKETGAIPQPSEANEEGLWTLSKMIGGYVGEVVIRSVGGRWTIGDSGRIVLEGQGLQAFPADKAWKLLTKVEGDAVAGYLRAIRAMSRARDT